MRKILLLSKKNLNQNKEVIEEAKEYMKDKDYKYNDDYVDVNRRKAKKIAEYYEKAKHEPSKEDVKRSYEKLKEETLEQFNFLKKKGVKFEEWEKEGQPYKNSKEMIDDVKNNKHLYFFTGGDMPKDHPLSEKIPNSKLNYNDVFRAVHDYFGHAKEGYGFGAIGEENAYRSHHGLYSKEAIPALTTETRGQNSWVNFGKYGEQNRKDPTKTIYAEQKALLLPKKYIGLYEDLETSSGSEFE
jgi:hypothetical protein